MAGRSAFNDFDSRLVLLGYNNEQTGAATSAVCHPSDVAVAFVVRPKIRSDPEFRWPRCRQSTRPLRFADPRIDSQRSADSYANRTTRPRGNCDSSNRVFAVSARREVPTHGGRLPVDRWTCSVSIALTVTRTVYRQEDILWRLQPLALLHHVEVLFWNRQLLPSNSRSTPPCTFLSWFLVVT